MKLTRSQVKYIQTLNEKKFRNEEKVFVAEGPKVIHELLQGDQTQMVAIYATEIWWQKNMALQYLLTSNTGYALLEDELKKISFLSTPNQVLGVFKQPDFSDGLSFANTVTLLLDGIQDPGNFGTIVRIADWFGISQIVAGTDAADVFNPKVVQSTMGSIARVKVTYTNIAAFIAQHPRIPVYAATLHGKPLQDFKKVMEGFLLIGNESRGLSAVLLQAAAHHITIPRLGHAESLNAAVATGILLSHLII